MSRYGFTLYLLTVSVTFAVVILWEFYIEDIFEVSILNGILETSEERWEYVVTSTLFVAIALLFPAWMISAQESRRKRAEGEVRKLSKAVEYSPVNVVITDAKGTIEYVNRKFIELTGYGMEEAIGQNPSILKSGVTPEETYKKLWNTISAGEEWNGEFCNRKKSGELYWEKASISSIKNDAGEITHYIAVKEDITERREVDKELRESEEKYRTLMNHAADAIIQTDLTGNIKDVNKKAEELLGYSKEELLNLHFRDIPVPEKLELGVNAFRETIEKGSLYYKDALVVRKDGKRVAVDVRASVIELRGEKITQAILRDITERKKAEEELRESEERLQSILDNSTAVVYLKDAEGRFILINWTFELIFHIKKIEIIGKTDYDIFPKGVADGFRKNDLMVLEANKSIEFEEVVPHDDGDHTYISQKFPLHDATGAPYAVCGISTDITERKRVMQDLEKAKAEAEGATELRDKFVALVSHDLKNPLATMLGYLEILQDSLGEGVDRKVAMAMESAMSAGEDMVKLIEDVLSYSRLKAGKIKPRSSFMDAYYIAVRVFAAVSEQARRKGIKLVNKVPIKTRLYGDPTLYYEVIQNLVSNAIKFSERGDSVTVYIPDGAPNTMAVSDTGVGVGLQKPEDLFSYEKKTSTLGTGGEKGTGFGLPLSWDIMKAHGGKLGLEPSEKGSIFYAMLPYVQPSILIVDDDEILRFQQMQYLRNLNVDIQEAGSGREALDILEKSSPHLIITDYKMPGMNGITFLERVKENPKTDSIPIIMVTANTELEIRNKAFSSGADDFVNKPLTPDDFIPRIRKFVV